LDPTRDRDGIASATPGARYAAEGRIP